MIPTTLKTGFGCGSFHRALATLWLCAFASACALSGSGGSGQIQVDQGRGFTIAQPIEATPEVREAFARAVELLEHEEYEPGIAAMEAVVVAAPDITAAHLDLGIAYALTGELDEAERSLKEAIRLNGRHPVAHNELGIVYRKQGRFGKARDSYERALSIYPDFHFARRNLAILCDVYLGDMGCAKKHYDHYIRLVPEDEAVAMWMADLRNRGE